MKIKIRYENEYQTLEVENVELERWLNIYISEDESHEDYEKRIQDVIEERFNRPDYNSWHKHERHTGNAYMKSKDGTVEVNTEEAIMYRAADKSAFNSSIDGVHNQLEYEECCETLRSLLKPTVADMSSNISSPRFDDMPRNPNKGKSRLEETILKYIDLENEIKADEEKLEHEKLIILEAIGKIEEPEYQTILISRYFKHQTWDEIAICLFYTKRWLYSLHGRALERLDEKLMES